MFFYSEQYSGDSVGFDRSMCFSCNDHANVANNGIHSCNGMYG